NKNYNFFYLMPMKSSNLRNMMNELTGEKLMKMIKDAREWECDITVPKFKVESKLDGVKALSKLGASRLFSDEADLSKISPTSLKVSKIVHNAVIEIDEKGTEAAASTYVDFDMTEVDFDEEPLIIVIDRPFLFGILRNDGILFIGQFV
ncbi:hypothetical protein PMAYCL1PPCAC_04218, partial [Pristionchus mayeri]